jgi:peptide/nickel transport system substrate-binding protein
VVDQNTEFYPMFPGLLEKEKAGVLKTYVGQAPEWEHLDFGIRPASYEDGYNPAAGDRADLFGDVRTRQAFAYCIDRQGIVDELLYRRSQVPSTFLPAGHPLLAQDLPQYAYDPDAGIRLLEQVGWKDTDGSPATPRVAQGVANVPDGTPLSASYLTTEAPLRFQGAQRVADSLRGCGIQVNLQFLNPGALFGPGPEGPVFGRQFDLVQFSWEAGTRPNCLLYASNSIPGAGNQWIGANVMGYSRSEFDQACGVVSRARPDDGGFASANAVVQNLFSQDLPVIPLYSHLKIALSRPDLCGFEIDGTARSIFWNLEGLNYGQSCLQE